MKLLCFLLFAFLPASGAWAQNTAPSLHIEFTPEALHKLHAKYPDGELFRFIKGRHARPAVQFTPRVEEDFKLNFSVIQIPHSPEMELTQSGTFDFWARIDKGQGQNGLLIFQAKAGWIATLLGKSGDRAGIDLMLVAPQTPEQAVLGMASFNLSFALAGCIKNEQLPLIKVGDWFRSTWVFDQSRGIFIYLNQQSYMKCFASRPNFSQMNTQDLFFGANGGRYAPFTGSLQDLMIYQRALTEKEVKELP